MWTSQDSKISGLILAGGQARRMGGRDKGLLPFAGRPLVAHLLTALSAQVAERLINANRNLADYARYGVPVIPDLHPGFPGPLAGIAAGMRRARHDLLLIVPCDGPYLPADLAVRLREGLLQSGALACVAHDGERLQPTYALLHRSLLDGIEERLERGEHRLKSWLAEVPSEQADFSDQPAAFLNINTPEELARCEAAGRPQ
jgi:molybdenum cofactor guanylyltransferase